MTACPASWNAGVGEIAGMTITQDLLLLVRYRGSWLCDRRQIAFALLDRVCVEHVVPIGREVEALRTALERLAGARE